MTTLTAEQLAEIEARANKATPGPWRVKRPASCVDGDPGDRGIASDAGLLLAEAWELCQDPAVRERAVGLNLPSDDNAAFIAHARTDIPALLAHVRALEAPVPMLLFCPKCGAQHVDAPDPDGHTSVEMNGRETRWDNPPHRSHLCAGCGHIWRPCDRATVGVAAIETAGKTDGDPRPVLVEQVRALEARLAASTTPAAVHRAALAYDAARRASHGPNEPAM